MKDRIVITFKGKIDADGEVKVPRLTGSHVSTPDRGMAAHMFATCNSDDIRRTRLQNMYRVLTNDAGAYWPNYVSSATPGFIFEPQANGFMAQVSITLDANAYRGIREKEGAQA